ncbi:MAG: MBL fold metallo-hydrolase [Candidatus Helarchaeota archaeon]
MSFFSHFNGNKNFHKVFDHIYVIPESPFLDSNLYVLVDKNDLMLIDSGNGITFDQNLKVIKNIFKSENNTEFKNEYIKKIIQTHCHIDHILGLYKFLKIITPKPQIIASQIEAAFIENADKKVIVPIIGEIIGPMFSEVSELINGAGIYPVNVDVKLNDGDYLKFGDFNFKIILTPGHTPGSICLYDENFKLIFTGDTVFTNGSFGRVDFPMGNGKELVASLKKLSDLNVNLLLPGHMNPVLKNGSKHIKLAYRIASSYL